MTGKKSGEENLLFLCQVLFEMGHSRLLFRFFPLFYLNVEFVDKILLMLGFKLQISGVGSHGAVTELAKVCNCHDGSFSLG